jgi:hypothetical protein
MLGSTTMFEPPLLRVASFKSIALVDNDDDGNDGPAVELNATRAVLQ